MTDETMLPIVADTDEPLTGERLSAFYDALFRPTERVEVPLPFDPDDYPLSTEDS